MLFGEEYKMKKYYSKISGCILLVALEILMFLWTPYYKGFICTTYIVEHINAGDIIFEIMATGVNEKGNNYIWRTRPNGKFTVLQGLNYKGNRLLARVA